MNAVEMLHDEGQSFWLDGLTRELLTTGALARYVEDLAVTGVTSNPESLRHAIERGSAYADAIERKSLQGKSAAETLFELALEDTIWAADLLQPIWQRTDGMDGWVSAALPHVAPQDAVALLAAAKDLHFAARRPNLLVEIPGTPAGLEAAEEAIFAGIPVSVTMLFGAGHYRAAANAYLHALERRIAARRDLDVGSIASMRTACWRSSIDSSPRSPRNQIADAVGRETYKVYRAILRSPRWLRLFRAGARPQRLAWTSARPEQCCAAITEAPFTVTVASAQTLEGLPTRCIGGALPSAGDRARAEARLAGIDVDAIALRLQQEALLSLRETKLAMLDALGSKRVALGKAG
jgi:transaldolase